MRKSRRRTWEAKRAYARGEILLAQGEIALTRSEIWLRHVKSALRRVSVRDCKAMGTGNRPLVYAKSLYEAL